VCSDTGSPDGRRGVGTVDRVIPWTARSLPPWGHTQVGRFEGREKELSNLNQPGCAENTVACVWNFCFGACLWFWQS
jgi:hypothetical protein